MQREQALMPRAGTAVGEGRSRRDGGGWGRLAAVSHRAYLAAWLYLGNLIIAVTVGWVPRGLRLECVGVATASIVVIVAVLVAPRPMRAADVSETDGYGSGEFSAALGSPE